MAIIKPFKGVRPPKALVEKVASRPYDVLNSEEAREEAKGNPMSLYHIIKPEINFEPGTDEHDPKVYPEARRQFDLFQKNGWLVQDEKEQSLRAGATYLAIAVMGGLVMLMGLMLLYNMAGTLRISELYDAVKPYWGTDKLYITGGLMLFGFGAKAGAFPLHIWLPKAHPVAPAPASALLSGVLTKAGVFGILVISSDIFLKDGKWGTLILIVGVITMFLGAILALFSVNLKRTLACSSVSQMGFILTGLMLKTGKNED